jgi:hypothetical protein
MPCRSPVLALKSVTARGLNVKYNRATAASSQARLARVAACGKLPPRENCPDSLEIVRLKTVVASALGETRSVERTGSIEAGGHHIGLDCSQTGRVAGTTRLKSRQSWNEVR